MKIRKIILSPWFMAPVLLALAIFAGCVIWTRGRVPPRWLCKCFSENRLFDGIRTWQTRGDLSRIISAVGRFESHYHRLPIVQTLHDEQFSITLAHELHGLAYSRGRLNREKIDFTGIPAGLLRDGWDNAYHVLLDRDGDGFVETEIEKIHAQCAVWSDGPNQENEQGTGDDIKSW